MDQYLSNATTCRETPFWKSFNDEWTSNPLYRAWSINDDSMCTTNRYSLEENTMLAQSRFDNLFISQSSSSSSSLSLSPSPSSSAIYQTRGASLSPPSSSTKSYFGSIGSGKPVVDKPAIRKSGGFETVLVKVRSCCDGHNFRIVYNCCNKELNGSNIEVISARQNPVPAVDLCRFCLRNGEPPSIVHSHRLRCDDGKISCPVLRQYNCPLCNNGGGDYAHTVRYCPTLKHIDHNKKIVSTATMSINHN